MDFFYWIGLLVFLYFVAYVIICAVADCDAALFLAEKFGKPTSTLSGKVIWITGASSGIGENLAYACAKVGSQLVLSARRESELERVKKQCLESSNGKLGDKDVLVLPLDILDTEKHAEAFDKVLKHFGRLDILVNNAGRSQRALWEEIDLDVDRKLFELNVFGVVNLTRIVTKYFLSRGEGGHIAVTSSTAGVIAVPHSGSYTASKHAIHGYFGSLRSEKFLKKLQVTIFCPGPTFTNFLQESFTGKSNEKFSQSVQSTDKRMTGERCGHLFAVALANELDEAWAAVFPIIALSYGHVFFPNLLKKIITILGPKKLLKLRDSRVSIKEE